MNKLDDKVVIRKSHLAALCGMLNPLNQNQDRVASEAIRLLDQDLTGWAAVPVKLTRPQFDVGLACAGIPVTRIYEDMLATSPPLPGGGE